MQVQNTPIDYVAPLVGSNRIWDALIPLTVMPPTRHTLSSEGVIFLFFFYKLINFKLVHLYNVKHLTCIIFCSSGLQNIYKLYIWKCSTFTIFTK